MGIELVRRNVVKIVDSEEKAARLEDIGFTRVAAPAADQKEAPEGGPGDDGAAAPGGKKGKG